jgi:DnaK suppressor protein
MQTNRQLTKQLLESKFVEITNPAGWRESISARPARILPSEPGTSSNNEMTSRGLSRSASLARDLLAALTRVAHGTYRLCIDCDEPIAHRRLAAVPWAARCLSCQENAETCRGRYGELAA